MPTLPSPTVPPVDEPLNCFEVWGGNGATDKHLARPGLDLWLWSQPQRCADAGGNDLHLVSSCASGRITRILLADVCAHGPLFGDIAGGLRELLKRNVNTIRQTRVVRGMVEQLADACDQGGFASTLMATYFSPTRSLSLCNAGHPSPLLFRAGTGEWSVLTQTANPATLTETAPGVVDPAEYQHFQTKLAVGDMVLAASNSVTECLDGNGCTLGLEGILGRVRQLDSRQPADLVAELVNGIRGAHFDNLADDDATVLLCQATDTPVSWRDNLMALWRLLRPVSDRTRFE